jgi:hypothetical protein
MRLITHLDPSQLRLGYLNCLVLVAGRHLDTRQGLVDRLGRFVFQPVTADDRRWPRFIESVDEAELEAMKPPVDERTAALHELFQVATDPVASYPLHALWLAQRCVAPPLGLLAAKNAERIVDMARAFDLLTTGYALSEKGVFLQHLLGELFPGAREGEPSANPFAISVRPIFRLFYLYSLLCVDALTPYLLKEFADEPGGDPSAVSRVITRAAERLLETVERRSDIGSVEDVRQCRQLAERVARRGVAKNQAQPRYFHLFELSLLERGAGVGGRVPYLLTEAGLHAAEVLAPLRDGAEDQQEQLDRHFFRWAAQTYQMPARGCDSDERRLLYFTRGYPYLEREIGFTPGRTVALAGCLLALEDGWLIEVAEMFSLLQRAAAGPWRPFLEYSGGSRLDQEFLIKIKPSLLPALQSEVEGRGAESRPNSSVQRRDPS